DSLSEHLRTLDRYTTLAAEELVSRKQKVGLGNLIIDPAWTFVRSYVLQRGFLDGLEGLTIAHMAAIYTYLKYAKARNMGPEGCAFCISTPANPCGEGRGREW